MERKDFEILTAADISYRLFNDTDTDITPFILAGRTVVIINKINADNYAFGRRSYAYPVYNANKVFVGYGIPK